jgi:hypothetical protein
LLKRKALPLAILWFFVSAHGAMAHVAERGLVLLLPTDIYIRAGVSVVGATLLLLFFLPHRPANASQKSAARPDVAGPLSLVWLFVFFALVLAGMLGTRDPLSNPLSLTVWTAFWIILPVLQVVFGDIWERVNPWRAILWLRGSAAARLVLSEKIGTQIACAQFIAVALFATVDIAPDDPDRLARFVLFYWAAQVVGVVIYGARWLRYAEPSSVFLRYLAVLSPFRAQRAEPSFWLAIFLLIALGVGSFDGLNETFWWLAQIGINPLAFPGRSAVVVPNTIGLLGSIVLLIAVFAGTIWAGLYLARAQVGFARVFAHSAIALLPIIAGYHFAHYLISFLVGSQYLLAAISDPFALGWDLLGLGQYYVTTGFLNTTGTVRAIWLSQAGAIVIGHVAAIWMSHRTFSSLLDTRRQVVLAHVPLGVFMVGYTLLGLWLLATPTGA